PGQCRVRAPRLASVIWRRLSRRRRRTRHEPPDAVAWGHEALPPGPRAASHVRLQSELQLVGCRRHLPALRRGVRERARGRARGHGWPGAAVKMARARPERFGGIVEVESPRALLHVDQEMMRELGYPDSALWQLAPEGPLSAPREVHVVLSRRCAAGCRGCYVDATPGGAALPFEDACRILDELAAMGVFHVALGGGEALALDYLFAVASHARKVGITPNLTTSGLGLDAEAAEKCRVFGQINVSVDGVGAAYAAARGFDGFRHAERALRLLRAVKREVGVNCVVSRSSFPHVPEVARLVRKLRLNELELLRFKPVGRGAHLDEELTPAQCREL